MVNFILRNIWQRIILLIFISIISHAIVHLAPGEPALVDPSNPRMKPEDIVRIRAAFHLDKPLHIQYAYWVRDLFTGELKSFKDNQPVMGKIWEFPSVVFNSHSDHLVLGIPSRNSSGNSSRFNF